MVVGRPHSRFTFDHVADGNTSQVRVSPWSPLKVNGVGSWPVEESTLTDVGIFLVFIFGGGAIRTGWLTNSGELHDGLQQLHACLRASLCNCVDFAMDLVFNVEASRS